MALVAFGALTISEAVIKLSYSPSRMMGLLNKGQLSEGADADITVVNPRTGKATMSLVAGELIMLNRRVVGKGGTWLILEEGRKAAESKGLPYQIINLEESKMYKNWK